MTVHVAGSNVASCSNTVSSHSCACPTCRYAPLHQPATVELFISWAGPAALLATTPNNFTALHVAALTGPASLPAMELLLQRYVLVLAQELKVDSWSDEDRRLGLDRLGRPRWA